MASSFGAIAIAIVLAVVQVNDIFDLIWQVARIEQDRHVDIGIVKGILYLVTNAWDLLIGKKKMFNIILSD